MIFYPNLIIRLSVSYYSSVKLRGPRITDHESKTNICDSSTALVAKFYIINMGNSVTNKDLRPTSMTPEKLNINTFHLPCSLNYHLGRAH